MRWPVILVATAIAAIYHFAPDSHDKTYVSFSGIVIRVGGELNAELEHTSAGGKAPGGKKEPEIESNQDLSHPAANVKKAMINDLDKQLTRR